MLRAVIVAQLVEWLVPIPEVGGSNPVISKLYFSHILSTVLKKTKIKKNEAGNGSFKNGLLLDVFDSRLANLFIKLFFSTIFCFQIDFGSNSSGRNSDRRSMERHWLHEREQRLHRWRRQFRGSREVRGGLAQSKQILIFAFLRKSKFCQSNDWL